MMAIRPQCSKNEQKPLWTWRPEGKVEREKEELSSSSVLEIWLTLCNGLDTEATSLWQ